MTNKPTNRLGAHRRQSGWWPGVARKTLTWYSNRDLALDAETIAIVTENPVHNVEKRNGEVRVGKLRDRGLLPPDKSMRDFWLVLH